MSETRPFANEVLHWASSLGRDWCKLVAIDLMMLFISKASEPPRPGLLQALNHGETPRQDWNLLLGRMILQEHQDQVRSKSTGCLLALGLLLTDTRLPRQVSCYEAKNLLRKLLIADQDVNEEVQSDFITKTNICLEELGRQHFAFEQAALSSNPPRPHAQTWVLSSLTALLMLCGGEVKAAVQSLEISAGLAWLVGDFESYQMIRATITEAEASQGVTGKH